MDSALIRAYESIVYAQAEIAGMQADNAQREHLGEAMAYSSEDFVRVAEHMRGRVIEALQWAKT